MVISVICGEPIKLRLAIQGGAKHACRNLESLDLNVVGDTSGLSVLNLWIVDFQNDGNPDRTMAIRIDFCRENGQDARPNKTPALQF